MYNIKRFLVLVKDAKNREVVVILENRQLKILPVRRRNKEYKIQL